MSNLIGIIIFLLVYNFYGLLYASFALAAKGFILVLYHKIYYKVIKWEELLGSILLLFLSTFTLLSKDLDFIKMKPTIIYSGLSLLILLDSLYFKKGLLKKFFLTIDFPEIHPKKFKILEFYTCFFLIFLSIVNEIAWRNLSEEKWLMIKFFILPILLIIFIFNTKRICHNLKDEKTFKKS